MKKLLMVVCAAAMLFPVAAQQLAKMPKARTIVKTAKETRLLQEDPQTIKSAKGLSTRADGSSWFRYCEDEVYQGVGFGMAGYPLEAAIQITDDMAKNWKGLQITSISVGFGESSNHGVMLYITEALDGYPLYMQNAVITEENAWNDIKLTTPFTIEGTGFYIGYQTMANAADDYPIGVDGVATYLEEADIIGFNEVNFDHFGDQVGSVCIKFELSGDVPEYSAALSTLITPSLVEVGAEFGCIAALINTGTQDISDLNISATLGGEPATGLVCEISGYDAVPAGNFAYLTLGGLKTQVSGYEVPIDFSITELKGATGSATVDLNIAGTVFIPAELFDRNVVVEEFTGTWCGYCPRGMVGMAYMEQYYGEAGFIGIAVHSDGAGRTDPMQVASYVEAINLFSQGSFPSAVMDRRYYFDPSSSTLDQYFQEESLYPAAAKVDLTALYDPEEELIEATVTTKYGFDGSFIPYKIALVITENSVGPYIQTNYFANNAYGPMGGWESKPASAVTMYNEVARNIFDGFGLNNSVPMQIKQGEDYTFKYEMPLTNIKNLDNCTVVAMLLNSDTYEVVNAAKFSMAGQVGVEQIIDESANGLYTAYNLQGVKVMETADASEINNLPKGVYIVNGKKVLVR